MASSGESARMEVVQCERQIQQIKASLRQIQDDNKPNSLKVVWTKLEGSMEESEDVQVYLQMAAPVEDATLAKIDDEASFSGVEASMATLTVTLRKGDVVLGTSEALDMAPICSLGDAMNPKEAYVTELPVAIVGDKEESTPAPAKKEDEEAKPGEEEPAAEAKSEGKTAEEEENKEEEGDKETAAEEESKEKSKEEEEKEETTTATDDTTTTTKDAGGDEDTTVATSNVVKPLATVTLSLVFKPSAKDQKEELYELLNKASLRRSQALERHRRGEQETKREIPSTSSPKKSPAVKSGFLNKKAAKKPIEQERNKWMQWYDKYLGPNSLGRGVIVPIAKNYVIFFAAIIVMHFQGQKLALPAPV